MTTTLETLAHIIARQQLEDQHHEFKRAIDNPESIAGELVAFANSDGGTLFVGVDDDGTLVGLGDADATFQTLTNICRDRCIPPISPVLETLTLQGHTTLALTVKPELNRQKPYRTVGGRFYVRVGRDKKMRRGASLCVSRKPQASCITTKALCWARR
jgi:ATP-dependent DNA helicase RecG